MGNLVTGTYVAVPLLGAPINSFACDSKKSGGIGEEGKTEIEGGRERGKESERLWERGSEGEREREGEKCRREGEKFGRQGRRD